MRARTWMGSILLLLATLLFSVESVVAEGGLTPRADEAVRAAAEGFRDGRPQVVLERLAPLLTDVDLHGYQALDEALARRDLPPLAELLADARLALVEQNLGGRLPRPGLQEAERVLPQFQWLVEQTLALGDTHPAMADPYELPATLLAFRHRLAALDVLESKLERTRRVAEYMDQFATRIPRRQLDELDERSRGLVENQYAREALARHDAFRDALTERQIELRAARLTLATRVLARQPVDEEHFYAAATYRDDASRIRAFLKSHRGNPPESAALRDAELPRRVHAQATEAARLAGDLGEKAEALFRALAWWSRGRFGRGHEAWGLAKSEAALNSADGRFALYMPGAPPRPTDPLAESTDTRATPRGAARPLAVPLFDRRHHYWWAWETRSVVEGLAPAGALSSLLPDGGGGGTGGGDAARPAPAPYLSCTPPSELQPPSSSTSGSERSGANGSSGGTSRPPLFEVRTAAQNDRNLVRLVGYQEYGTALAIFDRLIPALDGREFEAVDRIVRSDPQYTVYTNLSRRYRQDAVSQFRELPQFSGDDYARRGIDWVTGLARVEVAAMFAGFSRVPAPFTLVKPAPHERSAYESLLLDALRAHLWALQSDRRLRNLDPATISEPAALALERRVQLAQKLLDAVRRMWGQRLAPPQQQELQEHAAQLAELSRTLRVDVLQLGIRR